jgi:hypothetical protein
MKENHPQKHAIAKARIGFLSAMFCRFSSISISGIDVTEDDLATEIGAELRAIGGMPRPKSAPSPEPPQPPKSPAPMRAVVPFIQPPQDVHNAA